MGEYAHIPLNIKKKSKILSNWNSNKEILVVYFYKTLIKIYYTCTDPVPAWHMAKNLPANTKEARVVGLIPGSGRFPGRRNGNSLQYSRLEIPWTEEPGEL